MQAMAQVGRLVMLQPEVGGSRQNFFFAGIDKVRFRKPVIAGDTLVMRMTLIKLQKRFGIAKMEGKAYVGGEVVCEGEFLMATVSDNQDKPLHQKKRELILLRFFHDSVSLALDFIYLLLFFLWMNTITI
uniref:(3R)-hydroxymyristoyl-[acyl-carrier-protein] dehydratase n=1 Tax=Cajanus cajan TaxID=3821 RepID=A0A151T259_CAJCA|nr:(3R)-hydroxymyristoyl-[acyl-carrier-protein] dehydratase [Cajanus cajan]